MQVNLTAEVAAVVSAVITAVGVLVAWLVDRSARSIAKNNRVLELHRQFNTQEFYTHIRTVTFTTLRRAAEPRSDGRFDWWVMANTDFGDPRSVELADPTHKLVDWAEERRKDRDYWKQIDELALDGGRRSSVLLAFFTELEVLITRGQVNQGLVHTLFATPWSWFEQDIHTVGRRILQRRKEQNANPVPYEDRYRRLPWQVSAPRLNAFFRFYPYARRVVWVTRGTVLCLISAYLAVVGLKHVGQTGQADAIWNALPSGIIGTVVLVALFLVPVPTSTRWRRLWGFCEGLHHLMRANAAIELACGWAGLHTFRRHGFMYDEWFVARLAPSSKKMERELTVIPEIAEGESGLFKYVTASKLGMKVAAADLSRKADGDSDG